MCDDEAVEAEGVGLTSTEWAVLRIEQLWWQSLGSKKSAIEALLEISLTRYYQILGALIDKEAALAADPLTVNRLRRLRERRRAARTRPDDSGA